MTDEELEQIRADSHIPLSYPNLAAKVPALLDEIDFLKRLVHDLKEESLAYQRGVEYGKKNLTVDEIWDAVEEYCRIRSAEDPILYVEMHSAGCQCDQCFDFNAMRRISGRQD